MGEQGRLALIVALVVIAGASDRADSRPRPETISFQYDEDRLYVPVASAAGRPLGTFILDTGSPATFVDSGLRERLGIRARTTRAEEGAGRGTLEVGLSGSMTLRVGGVPVPISSAEFGPIDARLSPYSGRAVNGIVGGEFFRDHVVSIDFRRKRIELRNPASFSYHGKGLRLPFEFASGVPVARGAIALRDGSIIPLRLLIDLGAKANLLLATPFVDRHRLLDRVGKTIREPLGAGLGGETRYAFARLPRFQVGEGASVARPGLIVGLSVDDTLRGGFYDGLLGARFLRRFRVTFDYSRREVILEPGGIEAPDRFDRSGAFVIVAAGDMHRFVVHEVLRGSPAQRAGLRKGDVLTSLDGRPARNMTLAQARAILSSPRKGAARLSVARANRILRFALPLRSLL